MLQPLQLKEVSVRYTEEIAELRNFLAKAGCPLDATESLHGIATLLSLDRTFHRDLTSHIWVIIHGSDRQISYSDLLGVLAIAAAGTNFAAEAEEDDAHDLLRFLMESRRSFHRAPKEQDVVPAYRTARRETMPSTEPFQPTGDRGLEILTRPAQPLRGELPSLKVSQSTGAVLSRVVWGVVACVLAAFAVGLSLLHWRASYTGKVSVLPTVAKTGPLSSLANRGSMPPGLASDVPETMAGEPSHIAERRPLATSFTPSVKGSRKTSATSTAVPARPAIIPSQPATAVATATISMQAVGAVPPPPSTVQPAASATSPAVPIATLSKQLGVSIDSPAQAGDSTTETSAYPHLLRRRPTVPPSDSQANLVAELQPADVSTTPGGIVRSTSLGIMAANVLYGPEPDYPLAAVAAHVQGEVKVEAYVAPNGTVASARVISGPPLLRGASLDAVKRWHYRPYGSLGKPVSMTAVTVMDFLLP
jgi:TonB family protein